MTVSARSLPDTSLLAGMRPWTKPTATVPVPAETDERGRKSGPKTRPAAARQHADAPIADAFPPLRATRTAASKRTPAATTAKPTAWEDPYGARRSRGPSTWPKASVPHGMPPSGQAPRSCSTATHTVASAGARSSGRSPSDSNSPRQTSAMAAV